MSDPNVFEQMVAANPDRMSLVDANYIYREVNLTYLNDHRCRREDIIGKHVSVFLGKRGFDLAKPSLDSCLAGTPVRFQAWFDFAKSGRRYMDVAYHPYREPDGTITGVVVTARDCTEQRLVAEALAETKERLDLITETIESVVWFSDLKARKELFVSAAYERIWGRTVDSLYATPGDWINAIHSDDRERVRAAYHEAAKTGTFAAEYRIVRVDGSVRWISDRGYAVVNRPGQIVGIAQDITESKGLEQSLESEQRRLKSFLNNSLVSAFMKDEEGRYVFVSDGLLRHMESKADEWLGKTDSEIWPGPDAERLRQNDLDVIRGGKAKENLERTVTPKGRVDWWLANKFPFLDADGSKLVGGLAVNVTDRVLAQQEREKFFLLAERSLDFISMCNDQFVPFYVNPAGRELVGLESPEAYRRVKVWDFFFPEDQQSIANEFFPRIAIDGHGEIEIRFRHFRTGAAIWMLYNVFRIVDAKGQPIGWGTVSRNITEKKRADLERREREERLAHSQKLEAVGKLAAGMAHDINSLFMIVSGNAEVIRNRLQRDLGIRTEQKKEAVDRILEAVDRGKALLNKLMLFGRVRAVKLGPVALNSVVLETMNLIESTVGSRVRVELGLSPDLWLCKSDASQMLQVVMNLVLNASDAMPEGGRLAITTENIELSPAYAASHADAQAGPQVMLSVRDTGVGMDAETMDRAMEPYFSTKPMDKGSGLGLAIVHAIVKQAGGHLTIASEVGKGSLFRVYLPAAR